ncbi:hypothetical protein RJJ65_13865 [Rhizobium hidalgonense]|uniref:Uncharacterized protein n=1 Tax=Rhizobium hidalgonense TaxID=1538159 RepID=A0AAJ2GVB5_9HYPH|nr:hypothetical protein [Rhizobium hidalgonense]MDR9773738.1 hypothetical protein [Rhizobium hidalgonense]MDR9810958.1 hypothetical protein [Rhizobium hidalgonense]MDR9819241.1 hypothetical protein [Rhizobium hidalgonense]
MSKASTHWSDKALIIVLRTLLILAVFGALAVLIKFVWAFL